MITDLGALMLVYKSVSSSPTALDERYEILLVNVTLNEFI